VVREAGPERFAKTFVFLYRDRRSGKLKEMGLGAFPAVSLAAARKKAEAARQLLAEGKDPLTVKRETRAVPTFGELAEEIMSSQEAGFRNDKHKAQWRTTMRNYAAPLWNLRVNDIDTDDVLAVLNPIWAAKAETASRVRGRIERILDAAKAKKFRSGENPARWRGNLELLLPGRQKLQRGHFPAMPWQEVPAFIGRLRAIDSVSARCLEFVILTACRSGEVLYSLRHGVGGRPKGSRNKLGEEFVATLQADFMAHGAGVVERVRLEEPAAYLKIIASIIPKELVVNSNPLEQFSDEELAALMDIVEALIAGRPGSVRDAETADESLTTH
jgi:Arm DNA-binding domain